MLKNIIIANIPFKIIIVIFQVKRTTNKIIPLKPILI